MRFDAILRVATKIFLPLVLLFGLYVQFHGDYGPGGGFQAGVIVAAGFILYGLIYGLSALTRIVPPWLVETMVPLGVAIYAGTGVAGWLTGGNFLDYSRLREDVHLAQETGVFLVELGVLITVSSTMLAIFYAFAGRDRS
ncbi:MAG: Na(+)/H(+) antiporter subunit B [Bauldia sp.]|nr:Na(+)/H(+) antiporter subunit B [Bauldia sp.]